jgi:hypothetical protein
LLRSSGALLSWFRTLSRSCERVQFDLNCDARARDKIRTKTKNRTRGIFSAPLSEDFLRTPSPSTYLSARDGRSRPAAKGCAWRIREHDITGAMRTKWVGRLHGQAGRLGRPTENSQVVDGAGGLTTWTAWTAFRPSILHNGSYCTFLALGSGNVPLTPDASLRLPLLIKERSRPAVQAVQNSITARVSSKN